MVINKNNISIGHFINAKIHSSRLSSLDHAIKEAPKDGEILEFGVFKGTSINHIAKRVPDKQVYGFDSFEGLPEDWVRTKEGGKYKRGHFKLNSLPEVADNVTLIKGFFEQSLPPMTSQLGNISLLHNDSDLYSSTIFVLEALNNKIVPGTVIVFDELCDFAHSNGYSNWEEGEWKALVEWTNKFNREFEILGRTYTFQASIRVLG